MSRKTDAEYLKQEAYLHAKMAIKMTNSTDKPQIITQLFNRRIAKLLTSISGNDVKISPVVEREIKFHFRQLQADLISLISENKDNQND